jgi:hypothetical protein
MTCNAFANRVFSRTRLRGPTGFFDVVHCHPGLSLRGRVIAEPYCLPSPASSPKKTFTESAGFNVTPVAYGV